MAKADSELPPLSCRVIRELEPNRHPLCGIVAALRHARERALVVVGCDMPFVDAGLLAWLGTAPGAARRDLGRQSPAAAARPATTARCCRRSRRRWRARRALRATLESLRPRVIDETELARFGDPQLLCSNVNTPADLRRAEVSIVTA